MRLENYERQNRRLRRKWFVTFLCVCLILQGLGTAAFADDPQDAGLCKHHTVHTTECGYRQSQPGSPCTHQHTDSCKTDCPHDAGQHDSSCGYIAASEGSPCGYICSICSGTDGKQLFAAGEGDAADTNNTDETTEGETTTPENPGNSENSESTGEENPGENNPGETTESEVETSISDNRRIATYKDGTVEVTVTLPEDVTVPEGYHLYVAKITSGNYYPSAEAVKARASEYNAYQCYMIRWKNTEIPTEEKPEFKTMNEVLGNGGSKAAAIEVKYLDESSRLTGPAGGRKLLIFNSLQDGSLNSAVADTVTDVMVSGDTYTSFTFEARDSGPYVFVSKKLEMGYIPQLEISEIVDGTAPFDSTDKAGNDSSASNKIVRSYDTIQYKLEPTFAAREAGITKEKVNMFFELTLEKSTTAARFDTSKMLWLEGNYSIEYLDAADKVIMVMAHDGKFYRPQRDNEGNIRRDNHGFALHSDEQVFLNGQVSGSKAGKDSYKVATGGVTKQRLVGYTEVSAKKGTNNVLAGTQSFSAAVEVRNADNGEIFSPTFKLWLEGNENNYGPETLDRGTNSMSPAEPVDGNKVKADGNKAVIVSAGTNYNAQLKKNTDMSYKNWFDFNNGNVVASETRKELTRLANLEENHGKSNPAKFTEEGVELARDKQAEYANYRYGRITCYGITLQLYNDTDNAADENRAAKGLKGMSLPVGDITFDLNFYSQAVQGKTTTSVEGADKEYTAILWDYNENIPANNNYDKLNFYKDPGREVNIIGNGKGNGGRNIFWDGETRSPYAKGGGPSNYMFYHDGCYYGGDWAMVDEDGNDVIFNNVASPANVTGTGKDTTYHFSVSDYDFDFDDHHFPTQDAGNSGNVTGYDTYARCFSAGCVQVLSVFPMVQKVSETEVFLNTTVSNLKVTTRAGQTLEANESDSSRINHEVNTKDNTKRDQIVLYAPGNLTKGSAFNGLDKQKNEPRSTTDGYLGTAYWTTSYDCSTFAGDDIWITSYGMISSGSDYRMRSMNLLQLFDSRALSIRNNPDVVQNVDENFDEKGHATFLYAADPDYPKGYDTNEEGILEYMNGVREEDLKYFTTLDALNNEGYTCIGVLMELRNCDILGGKYQYMRIPVEVNGDDKDLVGKTVATVNTFRVWSENLVDEDSKPISWQNGQWDESTGKNKLEGYQKPANSINDDVYSGELANGTKSPPNYVKTEYEGGHQVEGTHAGGTLAGNSLLILSYKAHVDIEVDKPGSSGQAAYDQSKSETVVDYRLTNIKTEISDLTGQTERPLTELTIKAVLDEGHTGKQRISVSGGTYKMNGYKVNADGSVGDEVENISISSNKDNPTVLKYVASDGKKYELKVYAEMGPGAQSVTFVIKNAPVGLQLPDITFQATLASTEVLKNNDTIKTSAYISGAGDNRAYDETKGNTDNVTIGIIMRSGTNLVKAVDSRYIELNGNIIYTVKYANSGTETINKIYFYDLLPKKGDIRGSDFEGDVVLRKFNVTSENEGKDAAKATIYYSTTEYQKLYDTVKAFGGTMNNNGTVSDMKAEEVEKMLNNKTLFEKLGEVNDKGNFVYTKTGTTEQLTQLMSQVTGLYAVVEGLQKGQTINMEFTVETQNNEAADWYKNIANSWIADSKTLPLTSNKVETQVVSRTISGVVWHDENLNGVRDDGEPLLDDVICTLFKKEGSNYVKCEKDVLNTDICQTTTNEKGAYSFDKLAAGDYIVAFSRKRLEPYTSASPYQVNGNNDTNTNDGKAIAELKASGIDTADYAYFIQYSNENEYMQLHTINQMHTIALNNGVELYANQDLGVTTAIPELPKTGGTGTLPYTAGGILLMILPLSIWYVTYRRKHCK